MYNHLHKLLGSPAIVSLKKVLDNSVVIHAEGSFFKLFFFMMNVLPII